MQCASFQLRDLTYFTKKKIEGNITDMSILFRKETKYISTTALKKYQNLCFHCYQKPEFTTFLKQTV